jgi:hypothetical protein
MTDTRHPANVREISWLTLGAQKGVEHWMSEKCGDDATVATRSHGAHVRRFVS